MPVLGVESTIAKQLKVVGQESDCGTKLTEFAVSDAGIGSGFAIAKARVDAALVGSKLKERSAPLMPVAYPAHWSPKISHKDDPLVVVQAIFVAIPR